MALHTLFRFAVLAVLLLSRVCAMPAHDKPESLESHESIQAATTSLRHTPKKNLPDAVTVSNNTCYPTLASHNNGQTGTCMPITSCKGTVYRGLCNGPTTVACCVPNPGIPPPPPPPPTVGNPSSYQNVHGLSVDVAVPLTIANVNCLASQGVQSIIVRGSRSTGVVDVNMCNTLKTSMKAFGAVSKFDVYLFPCPKCSTDGTTQLRNLISAIASDNACNAAFSGRVWLDIEQADPYWSDDVNANKIWYQNLVDACGTYNVDCGIYSSWPQWQQIFGSTKYVYNPQFPLWVAHYDGKKTFSDFVPFGGWTRPTIKQFDGDKTLCGIPVDYNWEP